MRRSTSSLGGGRGRGRGAWGAPYRRRLRGLANLLIEKRIATELVWGLALSLLLGMIEVTILVLVMNAAIGLAAQPSASATLPAGSPFAGVALFLALALGQSVTRAVADRRFERFQMESAFAAVAYTVDDEGVTPSEVTGEAEVVARRASKLTLMLGQGCVAVVWSGALLAGRPSLGAAAAAACAASVARLLTWPALPLGLDWSSTSATVFTEDVVATHRSLHAVGGDAAARKLITQRLSRELGRALARRAYGVNLAGSLVLTALAGAFLWIFLDQDREPVIRLVGFVAAGVRLGVAAAHAPRWTTLTDRRRAHTAPLTKGAATPAQAPSARSFSGAHPARVGLADATFADPHSGERVAGVTLDIAPGAMVMILGERGAGAQALSTLFTGGGLPQSGTLLIDGETLTLAELRNWRARCALVPARSTLIRGTLADNLRLTCPDATSTRMWTALAAVGLAQGLQEHGLELDLQLGPNRRRLSEREVRRLSLARALLRSPRLLIVQEAPEPERDEDFDRILSALRGRSTVVQFASVLPSSVVVDEAYFIQGGELVKRGAADEVVHVYAARRERHGERGGA